ncbi:MAG: hypothetical protein ACLQVJ_00350 [Syntrophobacteraceae bacterium]
MDIVLGALDQSIDSIIRRLVRVGAKVVYHARRWYVHVAPAFPASLGGVHTKMRFE